MRAGGGAWGRMSEHPAGGIALGVSRRQQRERGKGPVRREDPWGVGDMGPEDQDAQCSGTSLHSGRV